MLFSAIDLFTMVKAVSAYFIMAIFNPLYIGIVLISYIFYKRSIAIEQNVLYEIRSSARLITFESSMYGILIGFIVSMVVNLLGIHFLFYSKDLTYIWVIVILLGFANIRYLSFSYAGGILALANLIFRWPDIDVSSLLVLVGLLHLIEAVLIWAQGYKNAEPVYVRHKGEVVGAFLMQKYWPIPLALLTVSIISKVDMPGDVMNINNPSWWPLMRLPDVLDSQTLLFSILSVPAILGYSEMCITQTPKERARKSGIYLFVYSILILVLSVISTSVYYVKYIVAILIPILHEVLIFCEMWKENHQNAYFSVPKQGIRVLYVVEDGVAYSMGIVSGDIILRINNKDIMTQEGLNNVIHEFPNYIWIDVLRNEKKVVTLEYKSYPDGFDDLGVLLVPRGGNVSNIMRVSPNMGLLCLIFNKIRCK